MTRFTYFENCLCEKCTKERARRARDADCDEALAIIKERRVRKG